MSRVISKPFPTLLCIGVLLTMLMFNMTSKKEHRERECVHDQCFHDLVLYYLIYAVQ